MKRFRRNARSERGAELIEFALVCPLLLLLILGMVDFGFLFQRMAVVTNAAREGARVAVLVGYAEADVKARVQDYVHTGGVPTTTTNPTVTVSNVTVPTTTGGPTVPGRSVTVTYMHQYMFLGPVIGWFGGSLSTVPLNGIAVMRTED
jgi:Flp pilus assembly protein TadG